MTTPLRVCCVTTSYPRSPSDEAGIFVERLVEALVQSGVECCVIVPVDSDEPRFEERDNVAIQRFPYGVFGRGRLAFGRGIGPNVRSNPLVLAQLPFLILRCTYEIWRVSRQTDVVHANWLLAASAAFIARLFRGAPYVVTCRGEDLKLLRLPVISPLLRIVLRTAAFVTTVSQQFREEVIRHVPEIADRVVCIPNGVTGPSSDDILPPMSARRGILYVGRVIPLKRLEWAIEMLAKPALDHYTLTICGRSEDIEYRKSLEHQAQILGVAERVSFIGVVPPSEIGKYLQQARYFVNFSEYEGRPNSVLEALAYGSVVLVSNIPAHREVVQSGRTGWVCSDGREAASVVQELDADPGAYDRISSEGSVATRPYTWCAAANKYKQLFVQASKG